MKQRIDNELRFYKFEPLSLLRESVDHFVKSPNSLPDLARSVVECVTALELAVKRDLANRCPALILSSIDDDGDHVINLFKLDGVLKSNKPSRDVKTAKFEILLKRLGRFRNIDTHAHPIGELFRVRNSLIHHEVWMDLAKVNYYLVANAYPLLKELLKDQQGKNYFSTDRWLRIEKLKDKKEGEYALAIHQLLALHAEKLDSSNPMQRAMARRMKSSALIFMDESVIADNLFCPACQEPTGAILFGSVPGEGPDGEMMYPYHEFRCRFCSLNLDETQINYIADELGEFELLDKKEQVQEWIIATGRQSAADAFEAITPF